eukprot:TRINITY_DN2997_c0_g1_i1.p2 TRINITY_DN2997_c0_g1~~TRINITY_DN2997_c0_g1_i1.p2  ORF type:complete len:325 (-),score=63.09 TRINITY_DN2997_c0_g1_i1:154-1128(-)
MGLKVFGGRVSLTPTHKWLVALVVVEGAVLMGFGSALVAVISQVQSGDLLVEISWLIAAAVSTFFLVFFAIDAVAYENAFELGVLALLLVAITGRIIWQGTHNSFGLERYSEPFPTLAWTQMGFVLALHIGIAVLLVKTFREFGNTSYMRIGTDPLIRYLYRFQLVFMTFVRLDVMAGLFIFCLDGGLLAKPIIEIGIIQVTILATSVAWSLIAWRGVWRESYTLMGVFFGFMPVGPAFLIWKLYMIYTDAVVAAALPVQTPVYLCITALCLSVRIVLVGLGIRATVNFKHGLREALLDGEHTPLMRHRAALFQAAATVAVVVN